MTSRKASKAGDPARVVGYLRCSTEEQNLGPGAQRLALERWCEAHGATLVATYEDLGVSGGAPLERRPGLAEAIAQLGPTGAGVLLVLRRDRLARDVVNAALIERLVEREGARVVTTDGTGNGDSPEASLMRTIVDAFSAYERALVRSRTKAALEVKKARGERVGGIPFGFRMAEDGVHLVADPGEQSTVARAGQLRAGGLSFERVASVLEAEGRWSRTGRRFAAVQVARMLER
ncbi:MAG: recombinase family protein [Cyanobacteria bacterium REEB65]|nr:recombinase family protein [Cyanobacteria bacterium REEB65]